MRFASAKQQIANGHLLGGICLVGRHNIIRIYLQIYCQSPPKGILLGILRARRKHQLITVKSLLPPPPTLCSVVTKLCSRLSQNCIQLSDILLPFFGSPRATLTLSLPANCGNSCTDKNDRRNSGGTLRQKFNFIDI